MVKASKVEHDNVKSGVMPMVFNVVIRPCVDAKGYWATCDMPNGGCTTQSETLRETQKNIMEAVDFYLVDYPEITDYYLRFEVNNA